MINWNIKSTPTHACIDTPPYIIQDIPNVPSFPLGNNLLMRGLGSVGYSWDINSPTLEINFKYPNLVKCKVHLFAPSQLTQVAAFCKLAPFEMATVEFNLCPAKPMVP